MKLICMLNSITPNAMKLAAVGVHADHDGRVSPALLQAERVVTAARDCKLGQGHRLLDGEPKVVDVQILEHIYGGTCGWNRRDALLEKEAKRDLRDGLCRNRH